MSLQEILLHREAIQLQNEFQPTLGENLLGGLMMGVTQKIQQDQEALRQRKEAEREDNKAVERHIELQKAGIPLRSRLNITKEGRLETTASTPSISEEKSLMEIENMH